MKLALLLSNYDTLSSLCCFLDQSSLLALSLACRSMKEDVIPGLLFRNVRLPLSGSRMASFCRAILAHRSKAGSAVRSIVCIFHAMLPKANISLASVLKKMPNICTIEFSQARYPSKFIQMWDIVKEIPSRSNLRHLVLQNVEPELLDMLDGINRLRVFRVSLLHSPANGPHNLYSMPVNRDSVLGRILLSSRDTLEELSLDVGLDIPSEPNPEFVWPRVHSLELRGPYAKGPWTTFDLSITFPSVRHFAAPRYSRLWLSYSPNRAFISRLTSIEAEWRDLPVVIDTGALLRRATIRSYRWTPDIDVHSLPSNIEYLGIEVVARDLVPLVGRISELNLPRIKVFHLDISEQLLFQEPERPFIVAISKIAGLSWCSQLDYLSIKYDEWSPLGMRTNAMACGTARYMKVLAEALPSVNDICLRMGLDVAHWRRISGTTRYTALSENGREGARAYHRTHRWL
ncbi:hypothetical protein BOTBODRAFT_68850 [Botryobasidium botryosum FD-172 SS1]|uniref:Uncharacterized protein n=1 Tax=Botryobasidium botryosum (strain FD-172 SS1) TaxID=930990 RepID=A0A067M2G7_BOTB1|nr:hypothetical protein BOTBODRAFT_68850 [Botryobasidium botryosum FD-172 SS1]